MPALTIEDRYNRLAEKRRINNIQHMRSPMAVEADDRTDDELIALAQQQHADAEAFNASPPGRYMAAVEDLRRQWQDINGMLARMPKVDDGAVDAPRALHDLHNLQMAMFPMSNQFELATAALDEMEKV